ncbi:ribonuclease III [Aerococcaceae bacterium zg-ZUI334]|uniref:ribonuclease III n=1 Tax=Aerococcaceae bacterium zg-252 TaxID=2796928 RepID=UPI001B9292D2|nr:ribonuclease III [Aerococcaceae bacterium zg-ZUI334]
MIQTIESIIEQPIKNVMLYQEALQHTTFVNEKPWEKLKSNERLEFLGDAVLEVVVSEFLFNTYPNHPEGQLTTMRAQLVQEQSLAYLARQLKLNEAIKLGKGELATGGNERDSILADAYEAILGAIFKDLGLDSARRFVTKTMLNQHEQMLASISQDYKTRLQELVQQRGSIKIQYEVIDQTGPAHDTRFTIAVSVDGEKVAKATGRSKKQAEMRAAEIALNFIDEKGFVISH